LSVKQMNELPETLSEEAGRLLGAAPLFGWLAARFGEPISHLRKHRLAGGFDVTWPSSEPVMTAWSGSGLLKVYHNEGRSTKCFDVRTESKQAKAHIARMVKPNDPSSATRRTGGNDCNRDAPAGFAAAHG
jgi:hypothetical protein